MGPGLTMEVPKMAERLLEAIDQDLMLDTPFLRRIREEGRTEGLDEGRTEGRAEGLAEGLAAMRRSVLDVHYRRIEAQLETITNLEQLRALLQAAIRATDVADFEHALEPV
jgi:flagellar biosynthesis/type III secretory pathway protein FliH